MEIVQGYLILSFKVFLLVINISEKCLAIATITLLSLFAVLRIIVPLSVHY